MACFGAHFLLAALVSLEATFSIFAQTPTIFPGALRNYWRRGADLAGVAAGKKLPETNPIRNTAAVYLHIAGTEAGYGFFAPNVPDCSTLLFEIHFPDGRVEYDLPQVRSASAGLRLNCLLDQIRLVKYEELRRGILKILTYSAWQRYPSASRIRAIFTSGKLPSSSEFLAGKELSYEVLYVYDTTFPNRPNELPE